MRDVYFFYHFCLLRISSTKPTFDFNVKIDKCKRIHGVLEDWFRVLIEIEIEIESELSSTGEQMAVNR